MGSPFSLGRLGEEIVARFLGFTRVPASGARWPNKEDLVKKTERTIVHQDYDERVTDVEIAQVKTTTSAAVLQGWRDLERHAKAESATPRWFEVVVTPGEVLVFEKMLVRRLSRGIGGDVEA